MDAEHRAPRSQRPCPQEGEAGRDPLRRPPQAPTVQDSKVEVLLPVTAAWAGGTLGAYLASFPSCHTVLHLHGFNHTNFLTFCYLENEQKVDRSFKSI